VRRWRFPLVAFPLVAIALGSGAKADAIQYEVTEPEDFYFSFSEPTVFTVRTFAWQYGVDSMLWLYNDANELVASNDDFYGLDSWLEVPLSEGSYRLRAGICCGNPDAWRGSHYVLETNSFALPEGTDAIPPTTTTSTTVVETTTTTSEVSTTIPEPTTTTVEEPTTTTEPEPTTTVPESTVPQTTTSGVPPTTVVEPPTTDATVPSVTTVPLTTVATTFVPVVVPEVIIPEVVVPEVVPDSVVVPVSSDPPPTDGTEPPFTIGLGDDQEDPTPLVSNGLRDGVTPEQQRVVVATSILTVMPVFRPTNATGRRSNRSQKE